MAEGNKWEGKASAKVIGASAEKAWSVLEDYCNVHKYLPNIDEASLSEGEHGKVGCVRSCTGPPIPGSDKPSFTKEKLIALDPVGKSLSYDVIENNIGLGKYVGTIKVLPEGEGSCSIEWSFVADPVPYWDLEKIMGYVGYSVNYMAQKIGEELAA